MRLQQRTARPVSICVGSEHSLGDAIATMLVATALLNAAAGAFAVVSAIHLTMAIAGRARARGWWRLAIAWWVVGALAFVAALVVIPPVRPRGEALAAVFYAPPACAGAMGGLAAWVASRTDPTAVRRALRINAGVVGGLLLAAVVAAGWAWNQANVRHDDIDAAIAEARAHAAEQAEFAERRAALESDRSRARDVRDDTARRCRQLVAATRHVELDGPEAAAVGFGDRATDELADRLVRAALVPADLGPQDPALPCLEQQGDAILAAYARALVRPEPWTLDAEISARAEEALAVAADAEDLRRLIERIDDLAAEAARGRVSAQVERATGRCSVARRLVRRRPEVHAGPWRGCDRAARVRGG